MDTASHWLFGATLTGFAMTDPALGAHPERLAATMVALVVCSHAPDFDAIARLGGKSAYLRWHRGATHSIPAIFAWPTVVALPYLLAFGADAAAVHLYFWGLAAVAWHVALDATNGYGVQCLRPFTRRWVRLDALTIWDPFLFGLHAAAAALWALRAIEPFPWFPALYAITFGYVALRVRRQRMWRSRLRDAFRAQGACFVSPCLRWGKWAFLVESEDRYVTGFIQGGRFVATGHVEKGASVEADPRVEASRSTDAVRTFLDFAGHVHVGLRETPDGWVVRWSDARFYFGPRFPFGVDVRLDRGGNVVSATIGWNKKAWEGPYV